MNFRQPPMGGGYGQMPSTDHGMQYQPNNDKFRMQNNNFPRRERGRSPGSSDGRSSGSDISEKDWKCTVTVKNILTREPDTVLEESLYHEFKKYGEIVNIIIKVNSNQRYAYVQYAQSDQAQDATRSTGKLFMGQELKVAVKGSRNGAADTATGFDANATRTVFVGQLDKSVTHGELREIFERFGEVVDVDIKKMHTGITTYSFVQYIDIQSAIVARQKMDRQLIRNNRIKVGFGRGTPTNSLWIGNLAAKTTENDLMKYFASFGHVQQCLIDRKVWQALLRYRTIESCTKAFAEMHGKHVNGSKIVVDYASPACRESYYNRMEKHGYLDRRQLERSPTPPDVHVNYPNATRTGGSISNKVYPNRVFDDKDRFSDNRYDRDQIRNRGSPIPRRRSPSPLADSYDSRKRKLSADIMANSDGESEKKKKKKKKKSKDEEEKRLRKERKKAEKAKKKAEKKEKKLKKLRELEEKRAAEEKANTAPTLLNDRAQESDHKENDSAHENGGISDVSQVTEPNEGASELSEAEMTNEDKPKETSVVPDEKPPTTTESVIESGEIKDPEKEEREKKITEDSSDSSDSSSSSSDSDSDDSSDDDRSARKRTSKTRSFEPKSYRQEIDGRSDYREGSRESFRGSKYYTSRSSSQNDRSPRTKSRSRSPYHREPSYDRSHDSPRYSRTESVRNIEKPKSSPPPSATPGERAPSRNADTLMDLLRRFPVMWQGLLGLKNETAAVQMHFLSGNLQLVDQSLPRSAQPNEVPPPLRISQRMKLEPSQLEGVDKRIQNQKEHCLLLALPCGRDPLDVHAQTRALKTGFIIYLQQKQAAGIINVPNPATKQPAYVVHIFPPCDFAQTHLLRVAPDLLDSAVESGHLMVLVTLV
ncbi:msx2-interacting protein-like isoform X2 [Clytia hemisphaerica]